MSCVRLTLALLVASASLSSNALAAQGSTYPTRPIRLIVLHELLKRELRKWNGVVKKGNIKADAWRRQLAIRINRSTK